jgi:hypothetical protein
MQTIVKIKHTAKVKEDRRIRKPSNLREIILMIGVRKIAREVEIAPSAVSSWAKNGKLPYSDYTRKTNYWSRIKALGEAEGIYLKKKDLL